MTHNASVGTQVVPENREAGRINRLPEDTPLLQGNSAGPAAQPENRDVNAAPGSNKITLRPRSAMRAEEAASGASPLPPYWWEFFENYLRVPKDDSQAKCSECPSKAA